MAEYSGWGAGRGLSATNTRAELDEATRRRAAQEVVLHAVDIEDARVLLAMLDLDTLPRRPGPA